jgi:MYXO-CTERM domain-containing protein
MGQAEAVVQAGGGVETGNFSNGQAASRFGDYSNMTVDPTDDCTFWYTQEVYPSNGIFNYDTRISSVKFPNCAANDFTITLAPATQNVEPGKTATVTVTTTAAKGTAEAIALVVQDLPAGVTGTFVPATVTAGTPSTLTLTATAAAPLTGTPGPTYTVIGKAPSAVHPATAQITVAPCAPLTCGTGSCGSFADGCGGTLNCGTCTAPQTCGAGGTPNKCGCVTTTCGAAGAECGAVSDGCGGQLTCGSCVSGDCVANKCVASTLDSGTSTSSSGSSGTPNKPGTDGGAGSDSGANAADGGTGHSGGCGCRTVAQDRTPSWVLFGAGALAAAGVSRRRRRR